MVHLDVKVDRRIHPRIIGAKGRGVRKIQDDFKVELRFPRQNDDPDIITISGNEDDVYDCKDHLLNIEEEFVSLRHYNAIHAWFDYQECVHSLQGFKVMYKRHWLPPWSSG